jgi:hypothetical protein
MKKKILYIALSFITTIGYAQQADKQLSAVYSENEIQHFKNNDILYYNALIYGLENATYTVDAPNGKDIAELPSISIPKEKYNFTTLGIKIIEDKNQYFKINGSNKLLVVKSGLVLKNELNNKQ